LDTYRNLSYKNILGKHWAAIYCKQAEFVIKTDDDVFVDMFATYVYTRNRTAFSKLVKLYTIQSHCKAVLHSKKYTNKLIKLL
jgi:hypothetical protein